ncbi:hypothetical protein [Sphingomonas xanthus]|uniref:Uncharacterized protein n=1 Tax=Sphingomonas xanthus TaxID=2594473 RepID=A0A516IP64_9SPHN|nr:hypothetical protein [Sphingomonas xanthus]QDP18701.1 hypothetical protein FMM02_01240 [Sphingomonas xanthus]
MRTAWISLASGLTWLSFDHAFEIADLIAWIDRHPREFKEQVQRQLPKEWQKLADAACEGAITIRARERFGHREVELGVDELRNFRFLVIGIESQPFLQLERFDFTFSESFKGAAKLLRDGFLDPIIDRRSVVTYKRAHGMAARRRWDNATYLAAVHWLETELTQLPAQTGLQATFLDQLMSRFNLPEYVARKVWTCAAKRLNWPLQGRPKKSEKEISRNS